MVFQANRKNHLDHPETKPARKKGTEKSHL
jgi:hypothetical protein